MTSNKWIIDKVILLLLYKFTKRIIQHLIFASPEWFELSGKLDVCALFIMEVGQVLALSRLLAWFKLSLSSFIQVKSKPLQDNASHKLQLDNFYLEIKTALQLKQLRIETINFQINLPVKKKLLKTCQLLMQQFNQYTFIKQVQRWNLLLE